MSEDEMNSSGSSRLERELDRAAEALEFQEWLRQQRWDLMLEQQAGMLENVARRWRALRREERFAYEDMTATQVRLLQEVVDSLQEALSVSKKMLRPVLVHQRELRHSHS
ncbi:MAG: hypothetical protein Q8R13_05025 [bacterium]|nr:hypothetical protein [bacterium]